MSLNPPSLSVRLTIFKLLSRPIGGEPVFRVAATRKDVADEREQAAGSLR
jgi:hypothetical protein